MIIAAAAEAAEAAHTELPMPALGFGLVAFAALMGMLFVTYAFRSVGTRH